jgi:omega-amidase
MRLALAQMRCEPGAPARNVAAMARAIRAAADRGCDVAVFPEMCDTGYHMPSIARDASAWNGGAFADLVGFAADARIAVVAGLSERDGPDIFNATAVIGPNGALLAKYRKIHLFTGQPVCEDAHMAAGRSLALVTLNDFRIGLMTCYDVRFPELSRALALAGAELLIVPAAFPLARIEHWSTLVAARAIENQLFVAAVNRVGTDHGLAFGGRSRILDPAGLVLASADESEDGLVVGDIDRGRLDEVRAGLSVFRDRRPDIYGNCGPVT